MAHKEQVDFFSGVRQNFPDKFDNVDVVDIGSMDINGNNRYLFSNSTYIGVDIGEGNNVDVVSKGHLFNPGKKFDVAISSECFEHDEFWSLTFTQMVRLTKPGGLVTFSCARDGRPEHGTNRSNPWDSPFTTDYYRNLNVNDFTNHLPLSRMFSQFGFSTNEDPNDLYFWGIRSDEEI